MTSTPLTNCLVSNRKRVALSQEEIGFLLGAESGDTVCRHERFAREPDLRTMLAYEAIYKRSASELFSGMYREIEKEVEERAKTLLLKMESGKPNQRTAHRRQILADIAGVPLPKTI